MKHLRKSSMVLLLNFLFIYIFYLVRNGLCQYIFGECPVIAGHLREREKCISLWSKQSWCPWWLCLWKKNIDCHYPIHSPMGLFSDTEDHLRAALRGLREKASGKILLIVFLPKPSLWKIDIVKYGRMNVNVCCGLTHTSDINWRKLVKSLRIIRV